MVWSAETSQHALLVGKNVSGRFAKTLACAMSRYVIVLGAEDQRFKTSVALVSPCVLAWPSPCSLRLPGSASAASPRSGAKSLTPPWIIHGSITAACQALPLHQCACRLHRLRATLSMAPKGPESVGMNMAPSAAATVRSASEKWSLVVAHGAAEHHIGLHDHRRLDW